MNVEIVHAKSQKMVEDIRQKAADTVVFDGRSRASRSPAPNAESHPDRAISAPTAELP